MEFFRNLTAAQAAAIGRPTFGTVAVNENINVLVKPPRLIPDIEKPPVEIPPPNNTEPPEEEVPPTDEKKSYDAYYGGGGGLSFGAEEEDVPETTEVVQNKSNIGKTILILTALGLGLWLLSGGKKVKVK
jgi:hypothetical protein